MSRSLQPVQTGLPTSRQRALVLLVLKNAHPRALHPVTELHAAISGKVPLCAMWYIVASLLHHGLLRAVGTNDRSAGFALTPHGETHAVREIEAEMTRALGAHETHFANDAKELRLEMPYRVLYQPPPGGVPDARSGNGNGTTEEGQA